MNTKKRLALTLLVASAPWPCLYAQTTPAAPATAPTDDEVIQLSPFEVSASQDRGYQATQTLAGTRIRTNLADVGSAIQVVTKEFLRDVGATDTGTLLQYPTNAEVAGTRGTYAGLGNGQSLDETDSLRSSGGTVNRIRGLAAADTTRDFFVTDIPWDSFNVDRIDIQRGPNSILFGLGSPAGIINASTRNAEFRNLGSVEVRTGSYGTVRSSLDLNQQIIPGVLAIRLDGMWNDQNFQQDQAFQDDKRFFGAIRFDPQLFSRRDFRTSIRAKFENGDIKANRPRIIPPNDAISPWFRALPSIDPQTGKYNWTADSGLGKLAVDNGYDSWRTDNVVPGGSRGLIVNSTTNYQPWLTVPPNQQQPFWLIDGTTDQVYRVEGGWVGGGRNNDGSIIGSANTLLGRRTADQFYGIQNLPGFASNANGSNSAVMPLALAGQYKNVTMKDPSIFDFYNNLIDGPTKWETEKWNAYNFNFSQTAFDDRLGIDLTYDRQKYKRAAEALLGGSPSITIDILKNFEDFYVSGASGSSVTNPNFGRPYVQGAGNSGGSSYESDRKYLRASIFGELRSSDFLHNDFLVKLLGKHRFNGVFADEKYRTENRSWQSYANSKDWAGFWNGNDGSGSSIQDRPPQAFIYLGSSVASMSAPTNIPGITSNVTLPDAGVHVFNPTWTNFGIPFTSASAGTTIPSWNVPASMYKVFNGLPNTESTAQLTQVSNPANYVGWTTFQDSLLRYNNGADNSLLTNAQQSLRVTKSYAGSWQAFLWNDAIVPTLGWRYDEVKGKGVLAGRVSSNRNILNMQPDVYRLPDSYPVNQIFKDHSSAGGVVVHLNKLLDQHDFLPINISLSYNKSSNFQVTDTRRNIYGQPIPNPTGATKEYGVLLSTKDDKYTLRVLKYETSVNGAATTLGSSGSVGQIVQQGMRWRNVFLYKLGVYDWNSRNQWASRNTWATQPNPQNPTVNIGATNAVTPDQGRALEDAAITKWNQAQAWLTDKGFFNAWGFQPQALSVLTNRSTYEAAAGGPLAMDPGSQYAPNPASINAYIATAPQGFTVAADTKSEGYEFEFTANPLPNWRVSFNAAKTRAVRSNVGGPELAEYVSYIDDLLASPIGTYNGVNYTLGNMPQFGNPGLSLVANVWNPWRGNYTLLKQQENADAPEIRKWRYNAVTNYTFDHGFLKGAGVGAGYRWQDKVVIGYPVVIPDPAKPAVAEFDLSKPFYGPSEDGLDLWVSYERKITKRINWRIQLNVYNVGKSDELIPISIQPDGKTVAGARIGPTQEWMLTNTFSF
jgi:hypothetical protein